MADNELLYLWAKMADRISEMQQVQAANITPFSRNVDAYSGNVSGNAWKNAAGPAKGQIDTAERIMREVEDLLTARGYNEDEILAYYRDLSEKREREAMST